MNSILILLIICWMLSATILKAQTCGCTDPLAANFNPSAGINDGSCVYAAASISPLSSFNLQSELNETSGLIKWNSNIWTHADNSNVTIYGLDTLTGNIVQTKPLNGVVNIDWEEISQDDGYVYIGDFGNNGNGNRTDLRILRIEKNSLLADAPQIDTIAFSYSNQTGFASTGSNNTDFDCEAFVVSSDSMYLFTKQWVSEQTSVYALPKTPGVYIAQLQSTYNVNGLITGSVYLEDKRLVALCGYSSTLQPFVFLLYDFSGRDFFRGNKRKIGVSLPFHQIEGITTSDGLRYYMSNEYLTYSFITNFQKLHIFDFYSYLSNYLHSVTVTTSSNPLAAGTTSGGGKYTIGQTCSVTASANPGYSFINWTENGTVVSTSATYAFTVKGNQALVANFFCMIPERPGAISGKSKVCPGQSAEVYTVPDIANATSYSWVLPDGASGTSTTNSITVDYGVDATSGTISVRGVNPCGEGSASSLPIYVNPTPATPRITLNGYDLLSDTPMGNQWYNQFGRIDGATDPVFSVTLSGDYYAVVTLEGCNSYPSNTIRVIGSGKESLGNGRILKIYPNPIGNELVIELEGNSQKLNFEIRNAIGQIVFKGEIIDQATVETSTFVPGVYWVKVGNGETVELKMILKE